jgi:hypothetical protein
LRAFDELIEPAMEVLALRFVPAVGELAERRLLPGVRIGEDISAGGGQ